MFLTFFKSRVRHHASKLLAEIFGGPYGGELFLCGGAFKPLLKRGAAINDLDLWVRDRDEREKLLRFLLERGAHVLRDFHPYCLKLKLDGRVIEITYHNVKDGELSDVLNTFDLAICGIGARYERGSVVEVHVASECWQAVRQKCVQVLPSYLCAMQELRTPSVIRTLHRMGQQAAELGFDVDAAHEHMLWEGFWNDYSEEQRRASMDLYFETMVSYKGHCDERLVRRATMGYAPAPEAQRDATPLALSPQHA